ncbi:hypothetical protein ABEB36_009362 [Hypothenemus hampei]|uniref:THAP-type domain-containing protein n=1 Tax=Hypothenemus hampei TaxID=57062 RepID=A0ABD1EG37_HYPHA
MRSHNSYCCVDNCYVNVKDGVPFFRFPKDPIRCQIWKDSLGFVEDHKYANLTPEISHQRVRICAIHFNDDSFTVSGKRLLNTAIPSKVAIKVNSNNI